MYLVGYLQGGLKGRCAHIGEKKQKQIVSDKNWVANDVTGYLASYGYQLDIWPLR